jgi:hypothetical protein
VFITVYPIRAQGVGRSVGNSSVPWLQSLQLLCDRVQFLLAATPVRLPACAPNQVFFSAVSACALPMTLFSPWSLSFFVMVQNICVDSDACF